MRVVGIAVLASALWTASGFAQTGGTPEALVIADFNKRVKAYIELTRKATQGLPPLKRTDDPAEIASREDAFGDAVRTARAEARPGDVLTPEIGQAFRRIIKNDFRQRPRGGQKAMLDDMPHFHPKVNQTYPSQWPLATFPATLLARLPELPDGLEYRLLSEALILHDVKANVIVDFMLDVF